MFLTGAPTFTKRAQPCQLFFSLTTLNTRTFWPFASVTSLLSVSFSSVRVSANLMIGLPLSHALL